jgi:hypothetical protein
MQDRDRIPGRRLGRRTFLKAAGADFWLTPRMELMDVVLPVATSLERLGPIAIAGHTVFLPQPVVPPIGEARGDMEWMWDLAKHLGMGAEFWNGDVMAPRQDGRVRYLSGYPHRECLTLMHALRKAGLHECMPGRGNPKTR